MILKLLIQMVFKHKLLSCLKSRPVLPGTSEVDEVVHARRSVYARGLSRGVVE